MMIYKKWVLVKILLMNAKHVQCFAYEYFGQMDQQNNMCGLLLSKKT